MKTRRASLLSVPAHAATGGGALSALLKRLPLSPQAAPAANSVPTSSMSSSSSSDATHLRRAVHFKRGYFAAGHEEEDHSPKPA